jgi:hypothetical protein
MFECLNDVMDCFCFCFCLCFWSRLFITRRLDRLLNLLAPCYSLQFTVLDFINLKTSFHFLNFIFEKKVSHG